MGNLKALSLRQPWASLVVAGKKTLELRHWQVSYRGPLAIHAAQTANREACLAHGLTPEQLPTGAILGTVDLLDIVGLDEAAFHARQAEHLALGAFTPPLYGWKLSNARALPEPVTFHGRMGLFNVPDGMLTGDGGQKTRDEGRKTEDGAAAVVRPSSSVIRSTPPLGIFELRVVPETGQEMASAASYRLALFQRDPGGKDGAGARMRPVAELSGSSLRAIADQVLETLRQNGYQATDLSPSRRAPFTLSEESGVRLALLFLAVRPIVKMARVEAISHGLRGMTSEELYYWFSKCINGESAERARRALRLLLAEE